MTKTSKRNQQAESGVDLIETEDLPVTDSEQEDFIPVLEFESEVNFLKGKIVLEISIFANGDIRAKLVGTDIAAEGSSIEEAIATVKLEIEEEYHFLNELKDCLSSHLKKQFDIIKKYF